MIPPFDQFIHPVLLSLKDGKPRDIADIRKFVATYFNLSEEDILERTFRGTTTKLYDRTQWSTTYLDKAGYITKPQRGVSIITADGINALDSGNIISVDYLKEHSASFVEFASKVNTPKAENIKKEEISSEDSEIETPEDALNRNFSVVNQNLADDLLKMVKGINPKRFEELVVQLLGKMGYGDRIEESGIVTQYAKDGGIDGIIKEDKLGLDTIYVQAKRWDNVVTVKEVRGFVGALDEFGGTKGVFITTSSFTKDALHYSPKNKKVILIDGLQLCNYMIEYNLGVSVKQTFEIKRIDTDFFED